MTDTIPDLSYICLFEDQVYMFILKQKWLESGKWDSKSKRFILVEYDRNGIYFL